MQGQSQNHTLRVGVILMLLAALAVVVAGCGMPAMVVDFWEGQDTSLGKRIAIAPFGSGIKGLDARAGQLQKNLSQALPKQGKLVLVDFAQVDQAQKTMSDSKLTQAARVVAAGRLVGVNAVVAGAITDLSVHSRLTGIYGFRDYTPFLGLEADLSVIDVASGIIAGQHSFREEVKLDNVQAEAIRLGKDPDPATVTGLMNDMSDRVINWVNRTVLTLPWSGYVLKVEGSRALVTVGADTGLPAGAMLAVYGRGKQIKSGSGHNLNLPGAKVAHVRLEELGERTTWAEILPAEKDQALAKIEPGMTVRVR